MGVCLRSYSYILALRDACRLVHARHDAMASAIRLPGQLLCHPSNMVLHVRQIERGAELGWEHPQLEQGV